MQLSVGFVEDRATPCMSYLCCIHVYTYDPVVVCAYVKSHAIFCWCFSCFFFFFFMAVLLLANCVLLALLTWFGKGSRSHYYFATGNQTLLRAK